MNDTTRIIFTQGGKGGVGKTEVALSLVTWLHQQGLRPMLFDFDIENTNKSGLQNFYPEATKLDIHRPGNLDEFFSVCHEPTTNIVLADMGAGAGTATYKWFEQAFEFAQDMQIAFTAVGVTNNDAGAVQSILTWANNLRDRVDYLVVLNEMHIHQCDFEYWHQVPEVAKFLKVVKPEVMLMSARVEEFQAELRNQCLTLQRVIDGDHDAKFFRYMKNIVRAKRAQRELYKGFDEAAAILTPALQPSAA